MLADAGDGDVMATARFVGDSPHPSEQEYRERGWPRCCAPDCGDKVKEVGYYVVDFDDGTVGYIHAGCVREFVHGACDPPHWGARGPVPGLPDVQPWDDQQPGAVTR